MNDKVVDIRSKIAHMNGEAKCLACGHAWQGVCEVGVVHGMECPRCGLSKGAFNYLCYPADQKVWHCDCECIHFIIAEDKTIYCAHCGLGDVLR